MNSGNINAKQQCNESIVKFSLFKKLYKGDNVIEIPCHYNNQILVKYFDVSYASLIALKPNSIHGFFRRYLSYYMKTYKLLFDFTGNIYRKLQFYNIELQFR